MPNVVKKFQGSKTRNIVIIVGIVLASVFLFAIYRIFSSDDPATAGTAKVQEVPAGAEFRPGERNLPKEYLRALVEENKRVAEEALKKGESSIPTLLESGEMGGDEIGRQFEADELDACQQQCVSCCQGRQSTSSMLNKWVKQGKISAEAAAALSKLEDKNLSVEDYAEELNQLVREGKLTPEQAKQLLSTYSKQKKAAEVAEPTDSKEVLNQLVGMAKLDPESANRLRALDERSGSVDEYAAELDKLVKAGKLSPEDAKALLDSYRKKRGAEKKVLVPKEEYSATLAALERTGAISSANAKALEAFTKSQPTPAEYAAELNRLVNAGLISPEKAQELLAAYRRTHGDTKVTVTDPDLAALQQAQQEQALRSELQILQRQQQEQDQQAKQQKAVEAQREMQSLQSAMSKQAQSLFTSWNPTRQSLTKGSGVGAKKEADQTNGSTAQANGGSDTGARSQKAPIIKAGSILFAVLDTGVNSDEPGPIMATITSGKYKGGKLLGGLSVTPDNERVMLEFNSLSMPDWPDVISIKAVAINPDTAKTAIASSVDHHYLLRYGSLFAANFLDGYAEAIKLSGSTTTQTDPPQQTNPELSPRDKALVGLGAVGKKFTEVLNETFTKKPTVRVESGVGLGIFFTTSVYK
jgi:hypothetical protein